MARARKFGARFGALLCVPTMVFGLSARADAATASASAAAVQVNGDADGVIVAFNAATSDATAAKVVAAATGARARRIGPRTHAVRVPQSKIKATIAKLRARRDVRYAEPDYIAHSTLAPNDSISSQLWAMPKIGATTAWNAGTGDGSAVVAVLDTGIDAAHPDLAPNIWRNDGSVWGCAAGTFGYDSYNSNATTADCDPTDDDGHGTHVSGTIGAVGNNGEGVAGVDWNVKLMGLKVLSATGSGPFSAIADGINRAVAAKEAGVNVRVINASLGGTSPSQALQDAINNATNAGIVFVAAAGNSSLNVDATPVYPCVYATICVAATDKNDAMANFSNYGATSVDIAAPGVDIISTIPGESYVSLQGTSMAAPHVTGAVALLAQSGPCRTMSAAQLTSLVLTSADTLANLNIAGNRRLNVGRAMQSCLDPHGFSLSATPSTAAVPVGSTMTAATLATTATTPAETVAFAASGLPSGATTLFSPASVTSGASTTMTVTTTAATPPGTYAVTVTGTATETRTATVMLTIANVNTLANGVAVTAAGDEYWKIDVPAGQASLGFVVTGATAGDPALYVRKGTMPTTKVYDCRQRTGTAFACTFASPSAGTYFVLLHGTNAYQGVSLVGGYPAPNDFTVSAPSSVSLFSSTSATSSVGTDVLSGSPQNIALSVTGLPPGVTASFNPASVTAGAASTLTLTASLAVAPSTSQVTITATAGSVTHTAVTAVSVVPASVLSNATPITVEGSSANDEYFKLDVPVRQPSLAFVTAGGSGDVDMYARFGSAPSTTSYDCTSAQAGTANEACTLTNPGAGSWYVMLHSPTSYTGVTLTGSYPSPNDWAFGVASSDTMRIPLGTSSKVVLPTRNVVGSSQGISFSIAGLPAGVTGAFDPPVVSGADGGLTLTAVNAAALGTYSVTLTGTGSLGVTHSVTVSLVVVPSPVALTNNSLVAISGAQASRGYYKLDVPAGQSSLTFMIAAGTGDADLFVSRGMVPSLHKWECRPSLAGTNETCTFNAPAAGTWYVMVYGYGAYGNVALIGAYPQPSEFTFAASPPTMTTKPGASALAAISTVAFGTPQSVSLSASGLPAGVTASFSPATVTAGFGALVGFTTAPSTAPGTYTITLTGSGTTATHTTTVTLNVGNITALANGAPVNASAGANSDQYWQIDVPAGRPYLSIGVSGGTGVADLYVAPGQIPTPTTNACARALANTNATCQFTNPAVGTWYVLLHAETTYSNATLVGAYGGDFTLTASPPAAVTQESATTTTVVTSATDLAPDVSLSASGLPPGVIATFNPQTVTAGSSSQLTLSAAADAPVGTYTVTVTGTSAATTHTTPVTLTIIAAPTLTNAVTVTAAGAAGSDQYWKIDVPAGQDVLQFDVGQSLGFAQLYVRRGAIPTATTNDCAPAFNAQQSCFFAAPGAGTWYVMVHGATDFSSASLTAQYAIVPSLTSRVYSPYFTGDAGSRTYFKFTVPAGQHRAYFTTRGLGNADLYVQNGALPALNGATCQSTRRFSTERCLIKLPAAGVYYVMVYGAAAYSTQLVRAEYR